ncbi:MAG: ribosome biogenesis GTPase Der [Planctomycetes bacterium]|nr:ribosome biogenesis GTPase Der [Planctomycetota bacterium]
MGIPQVAIVGRPNVGKSSLFNWLAGRRIAIVDPTPGVTRDRLKAPIEIAGRYVEIVDTGGMGIEDVDDLTRDVERQIDLALKQADVILFVVDTRSGLVPLDDEVAGRLRGIGKPVLLVANKCDTGDMVPQAAEFHGLGFGDVLCVSAKQNRGKGDLLEWIRRSIPAELPSEPDVQEPALKLAIVGKRNTGKSTFINCLAREERTIVSEVEGTTRDSVDIRFEKDKKIIVAIDTAGVRNKGKVKTNVDFYSLARAERSIRRADVVLHFFDAAKKVSHVDKQLASYVLDNYKPAIFVVNKWDLLVGSLATGEFGDYLRKVLPSLDYVPIAFITAKDGKNVQQVLDLAQNLHKQASARVGTGELNRVVERAIEMQSPSIRTNRQGRIYYATQAAANPPLIVLFTNGPQLFDKTYQRYLLKVFRDHLPFRDVPIKMYLRAKERMEKGLGEKPSPPKPAKIRARPKVRKGEPAHEVWRDV